MGKFIDLTGQKFGRLTVIKRAENKGKHSAFICRCECGNSTIVLSDHLKSGHTMSCGCVKNEKSSDRLKTHGRSDTRIYCVWAGMKQRCCDANSTHYKDYGGRGITICPEWLDDFQAFYDWAMANGYANNLTLDRKDVNHNYEPSNCRWVTQKEQLNNTRRNRVLEHNGKIQTLAQWAEETQIPYGTLWSRLKRHWSVEKTLAKK